MLKNPPGVAHVAPVREGSCRAWQRLIKHFQSGMTPEGTILRRSAHAVTCCFRRRAEVARCDKRRIGPCIAWPRCNPPDICFCDVLWLRNKQSHTVNARCANMIQDVTNRLEGSSPLDSCTDAHDCSRFVTDGDRCSGRVRRSTTARLAEQGFITGEPNHPMRTRRLKRTYTPEPVSPVQEDASCVPKRYISSPAHICCHVPMLDMTDASNGSPVCTHLTPSVCFLLELMLMCWKLALGVPHCRSQVETGN